MHAHPHIRPTLRLWLLTTILLIGTILAIGLSITTHRRAHTLSVATAELMGQALGGAIDLIGTIHTFGVSIALRISVHTVSVTATELIIFAACLGSNRRIID